MGRSKTNHRSREGTKAGVFGLVCNLMLAAAKCAIGLISNSIAVAADGVNNLTDSVSAVLSILGFRLEAVEEDRIHPYGHGRIEYVTGFLISLLILGTGLGVGKEAVKSVLHPEAVSVSALTIGVLALSVAVKLGVMFYCDRKNKVLASPALEAIKKDSLCDACASALTLTGILIMPYSSLPLDGMMGIVMAVYIFLSGVSTFLGNLSLLLGEGLSRKTECQLREILAACAEIESVGGITVHDYGSEKKIVVAEVNFADSCAREDRQKTADSLTRFCKEHMDIDLSLYLSL